MNNRELFLKDPLSWRLVNEGVSSNNATDAATVRYELETFVCQGEYHTGLAKILQGYLDSLGKEQRAAWVSGFYGSGKSHLVKVLRYLWTDFKFDDGITARSLASLPSDVSDLLKELSTRGKQAGGLHSAGGTLKAGVGSVRLRLLGILLQSLGFPEKLPVAELVMDLRDEGKLKAVTDAITQAGKDARTEFEKLYTSKAFQEAYLQNFKHLGDTRNVSEALRTQYPPKVEEITIEKMVGVMRRALSTGGKLPCTLVVLDEVQQFINNNNDTANEVQEVVEACCKMLDGRVLFVGTGQSALNDTAALQKLLGRFTTKVHLKDNDVERVVRTIVLQKNENRKKDIEELVSRHSGEITRQLKATRIASRNEDDRDYVADYPLLPVRRRFWEQVLHSTDPTGTAAQMRTQLRLTHDACRAVADKPLGSVIPADFLYDQLANDFVISGEMQKRFQEIIEEQKNKADGSLRSRICALVFLINKVTRTGVDIGLKANPEHLADLLTDDLGQSAATMREKIPPLVQQLAGDGVLMEIDGEYQLQTTEGAAWEAEYRRRRATILNNDPQIASHRGQLLSKGIQTVLSGISVLHGAAREKRKVTIHHGMTPPAPSDGVSVWVRDGFQESENSVIQDIQKRSVDDATIHVLIPKARTDELKNALASSLAAEETINFKGNPSSQEGKQARASMITRQTNENTKVDDLIAQITGGARVFLSGGQELPVMILKTAVEDAANQVLARLYPKFHIADSANWPTVLKKAKEGNAAAFTAVGHQGDPDKQAVAVELIRFIGAGKKGAEIVNQFTQGQYGWPKDAIDATIAVLLVSGHLNARLQGNAVKLSDLDQKKISQADYRIEHPVLTAVQKLRIKKLFQEAGHKFQPGDEAGAAPGFVQTLKALARSAGGDAPAPEPPHAPEIIDLEGRAGNDLLVAIFDRADDLSKKIVTCRSIAAKVSARMPSFGLAEKLHAYAPPVGGMPNELATLNAVRKNRSLLDDPDPVTPILKTVAATLRTALLDAHREYERVLAGETTKLEAHPAWSELPPAKRMSILDSSGIASFAEPIVSGDSELLTALQSCDVADWRTQALALPARFAQAVAAAIREAMPKARRIHLPAATIQKAEEIQPWLNAVRAEIEEAIKEGPVIV